MGKLTRPQKEQLLGLMQKAYYLYKQGKTYREIGKECGKSHAWAYEVVKHYESEVLDISPCCGANLTVQGKCSQCFEGVK